MEDKTIEVIMKEHPLFQRLKPEYTSWLRQHASYDHFEDGDMIFHANELCLKFYIVLHGRVTVERPMPGASQVLLRLRDGDVLGWSWLFPPYRWHFDAQARTDTTLLAFDARAIRAECEKNHDLGYELMKRFSSVMLGRLKALELAIGELKSRPRYDAGPWHSHD